MNVNNHDRRKDKDYLLAKYEGKCALCGEDIDAELLLPDPRAFTVDHIVPKSRGGCRYDVANKQPAHNECNRVKANRVGEELMLKGPWRYHDKGGPRIRPGYRKADGHCPQCGYWLVTNGTHLRCGYMGRKNGCSYGVQPTEKRAKRPYVGRSELMRAKLAEYAPYYFSPAEPTEGDT